MSFLSNAMPNGTSLNCNGENIETVLVLRSTLEIMFEFSKDI
jgi:hypothetical protein